MGSTGEDGRGNELALDERDAEPAVASAPAQWSPGAPPPPPS